LKKIARHFYSPTRTAIPTEQEDSGKYSVRRATLLGQLLQTLSWDEFEQYAERMDNSAPHPAGSLEICVLSHLMKKDIQVYRQVDELQEKASNPVLAICLDTLSKTDKSFKILLHKDTSHRFRRCYVPPRLISKLSRYMTVSGTFQVSLAKDQRSFNEY
jgi:hypothetical protein